MCQQLKSEGRESLLFTSVGRIMKANQQQTADVWMYFSPAAQKTLPVAKRGSWKIQLYILFKGKKLNNVDINGLRMV